MFDPLALDRIRQDEARLRARAASVGRDAKPAPRRRFKRV
jgi:hypothetical protein